MSINGLNNGGIYPNPALLENKVETAPQEMAPVPEAAPQEAPATTQSSTSNNAVPPGTLLAYYNISINRTNSIDTKLAELAERVTFGPFDKNYSKTVDEFFKLAEPRLKTLNKALRSLNSEGKEAFIRLQLEKQKQPQDEAAINALQEKILASKNAIKATKADRKAVIELISVVGPAQALLIDDPILPEPPNPATLSGFKQIFIALKSEVNELKARSANLSTQLKQEKAKSSPNQALINLLRSELTQTRQQLQAKKEALKNLLGNT